ncbi:YiaA/YiaB family inner membrane protein [Maricaulis sp.]|uniref:YiaA/YiaB family inner membrane protein n=1 Tax=Maricaulis sp. TaxID=1486257 RepID=UPI002B2650FA|nr:YiaA/YiaB family inner membrane protein [Maricaulis sp.]
MLGQSKLWISFNYACVAIAYAMLGLSLLLVPVDLSTKGYVGMGILFLTGSLITLVKTLQEQRINDQFSSKLERAKHEKILEDYVTRT